MDGYFDKVTASFHRCRNDPDFVDTFYDIFLSTSQEIAAKFAKTDFKIQKLMLRESLLTLLCFNLGMAGTKDEIVRLAKRHKDLDVKPEHYKVWLDSLCDAIHRHDPEYTLGLEALWRVAMQKGIDAMLDAYDD
jgi:hemoglobin-like flavoprotein